MEAINQSAAEHLQEKKIIEVGKNYIKLDNGLCIYLDINEIEHLNGLISYCESKKITFD
jgi:hypothetical protein